MNQRTSHNAKKRLNLDLKMELYTKVNGKEMSDMAMVFRNGRMVQSTKVTGKIIKLTDKECFGMSTVINMKVGGSETRPMDMVNTPIATELLMRVTGKMIFNMAKA